MGSVSKAVKWGCDYDGIEINTKYLKFTFLRQDKIESRYSFEYGYELYQVEYNLFGNNIALYVKSTIDRKRDFICSLTIPNEPQRNELLFVLEFMKAGNSYFSEPFDTSVLCIDEFRNEDLIYDYYFREGPIKPLTFYAEAATFNEENESGKMFDNSGLSKVTFRVSSANLIL